MHWRRPQWTTATHWRRAQWTTAMHWRRTQWTMATHWREGLKELWEEPGDNKPLPGLVILCSLSELMGYICFFLWYHSACLSFFWNRQSSPSSCFLFDCNCWISPVIMSHKSNLRSISTTFWSTHLCLISICLLMVFFLLLSPLFSPYVDLCRSLASFWFVCFQYQKPWIMTFFFCTGTHSCQHSIGTSPKACPFG